MAFAELISSEIRHIDSILESVPFDGGAAPKAYFLDICKLTHTDISRLNITDAAWEATQLPVSKLLKLAISFGNLMKTFHNERAAHDARTAARSAKPRAKPQASDPFGDAFVAEKPPVAPHYVAFARNLQLILRNFDVGTHAPAAPVLGRSGRHDDGGSAPGSAHTSPIRVNSRQLLIEKLDLSIRLDALFTLKIVLKLLRRIYAILGASAPAVGDAPASPAEHVAEAASIFSSVSSASSGTDPVASMDDYVRLVADTVVKVNYGITEPFTRYLKQEVVDRKVVRGFQNLLRSI